MDQKKKNLPILCPCCLFLFRPPSKFFNLFAQCWKSEQALKRNEFLTVELELLLVLAFSLVETNPQKGKVGWGLLLFKLQPENESREVL
jgi:hypothetical protein